MKKAETSDDEESELLTSPAKALIDKSPSPKSRLRRQAEQAGLKLSIPKKISDASTTSEVSDHLTAGTPVPLQSPRSPRTPRSPMFTLENLHDIEELLDDFPDASKSTEKGTKENTPDVKDNFFRFEVPVIEQAKKDFNEVNDDIIVTEDDVDEELIEIVISEESVMDKSEAKIERTKAEISPKKIEISVKKEKQSRRPSKAVPVPEDSSKMSTTSEESSTKSKRRRRHKKDKKRKSSSKSCYYCKNVRICKYLLHSVP